MFKFVISQLYLKPYAFLAMLVVLIGLFYFSSSFSTLSILSTIFLVLYVFYVGEGKFISFIFGIAYILTYGYISYKLKLYGELITNLIYLPINIYGLISWFFIQQRENITKVKINSAGLKEFLGYLGLIAIIYLLGIYLLLYMDAKSVYVNAFTLACQIVATIMQVKRVHQTYLILTISNIIAIYLYANIVLVEQYYTKDSLGPLISYILLFFVGLYYWYVWYKDAKSK